MMNESEPLIARHEVEIVQRASRVRLLLMDCDGVLTDGRIELIGDADEQKSFHTRDGHGLVLLHRAGLRSGIISGRASKAVERRARDLGIEFVRQGTWDKIRDYEEVLVESAIEDESEVAFIGDDVTDIPLMMRAGLAIAVRDAVPETLQAAHYITNALGGFGAVREATEMILKSQGRWAELMHKYTGGVGK